MAVSISLLSFYGKIKNKINLNTDNQQLKDKIF